MPFEKITQWLNQEKTLTSANCDRAVLATTTDNNIPHNRVVAIREITPQGILFFTQRGKRKFNELIHNPHTAMTFWLVSQQRQIMIEGITQPLTHAENLSYWQTIPREQQLRFSTYAPTSTQTITSINVLEQQYQRLSKQYQEAKIPMSEFYVGFRLLPETFYFYTLGTDSFSEYLMYTQQKNIWTEQLLSP